MSSQAPKKYRKLNLDLVLSSTSLTRSSKETHEGYLARVTHLHLQNKNIRRIQGLELCTNLKVLYLYDNQIDIIQGLEHATILQYLYLHNNKIKDVPMLEMPSLKKLYLDENELSVVMGLNVCENLEELHVASQRLPSYTSLQFDPDTMQAICRTLQVLEISNNAISNLNQFSMLFNLRKMLCKDNAVMDLAEVECIVSLPRIEECNFIGNPCCLLLKYRDITIGSSSDTLVKLDEVEIPSHQHVGITGLMEHRRKIGAMSRFHTADGMQDAGNSQDDMSAL